MRQPTYLFLAMAFVVTIFGCSKIEYCDFSGSTTVTKGERTLFEGCAPEKFDNYSFTIESSPLGEQAASVNATIDPTTFTMHENGDGVVSGTVDGCMDFVEITFKKVGTYELVFEANTLRAGYDCSDGNKEGSLGKREKLTIEVVE